jgi:hypothetical protein
MDPVQSPKTGAHITYHRSGKDGCPANRPRRQSPALQVECPELQIKVPYAQLNFKFRECHFSTAFFPNYMKFKLIWAARILCSSPACGHLTLRYRAGGGSQRLPRAQGPGAQSEAQSTSTTVMRPAAAPLDCASVSCFSHSLIVCLPLS